MAPIKPYQKVVYFVILAIAVIWCGGILLAPLWAGSGGITGAVSHWFYSFFSHSCHQNPERSFLMGEFPFGVCSRCTAIYFAFLAGVLVYPFIRKLNNIDLPSLLWLGIGVLAVVIDVGLDMLDIKKNTFLTRDISGALIGIVLPFYIIPGTMRVFYEFFTDQKIEKQNSVEKSRYKGDKK